MILILVTHVQIVFEGDNAKLIDEICSITLKIGYEFNPNKIFQDIESTL